MIAVSIPKRVSEALKRSTARRLWLQEQVSIPKRVSEALKRELQKQLDQKERVSIPKRVSEALKLMYHEINVATEDSQFQSLKGFQRL